jgi:predicted GNAT family N-acyltransferase
MGVNQGQIGRMAVLPQFRGKGIGKAILLKLVALAQTQKISSLMLHSQALAIPFYEKYGFNTQGPIYEEAGIDHRNMILLLPISH